jgi:hypothetical protein
MQGRASPSSPIEPPMLIPLAAPDYQGPAPLPFFLPVEQINKVQASYLACTTRAQVCHLPPLIFHCKDHQLALFPFSLIFSYSTQQRSSPYFSPFL